MDNTILLWVGFNLFVILMLAIDLGLFHRKAHEVKFREAIMWLRSLYFALAGSLKYFTYLHYGLALILVFVGIKMLISEFYKLNPFVSLGIIGVILAGSIAASFIWKAKEKVNHGGKSSTLHHLS